MTKFNRRNVLKAAAAGGSGLAALAYSPKPTLAASDWTVNSPSEVSNDNGELSSLEIPSSGFSFSLDYSGLGSGSHSINFELEAKLAGASSFDTVFSESFDVSGESGTVSESKLSTSFPVDLLANTSMSASDFAEPNAGETEITTVDLHASFNWSDGEYSASASSNDAFDVTVKNIGPALDDGFESYSNGDINPGGWTGVGNNLVVDNTEARGSLAATHDDSSTSEQHFEISSFESDAYTTFSFWYYEHGTNSCSGFRVNDENGNQLFGVYTDNPTVRLYDGGHDTEVNNPDAGNYNWYKIGCSIDWSNRTVTAVHYDANGNSLGSASQPLETSGNNISQLVASDEWSGNWNPDGAWVDNIYLDK